MKKMIMSFLAVCMTVVMFTSCDPDKDRCWLVTYQAAGVTVERYMYCSENDIEVEMKKITDKLGVKVTKKPVNKNEADCNAANPIL